MILRILRSKEFAHLGFVIRILKSAQIPQIDLGFEVMETKEICDQIKD